MMMTGKSTIIIIGMSDRLQNIVHRMQVATL